MTTNIQQKKQIDLKHKIILRKFKLLLNSIQNDKQSFKFIDTDLKDLIKKNNSNNVNLKIELTGLKEPESGFGITEWEISETSKILEDTMKRLRTYFLGTLEEHEIMYKDAEWRPEWDFASNDCFSITEYQLMYKVVSPNCTSHPSFRFIHEEHTIPNESSYSIITNACGIYLVVLIVVVPFDDSQRVQKLEQGLIEARQLKEKFRIANDNNEKVVCVLGAIIMNETEINESTITFVDKKDEEIARAADVLYLNNKQEIDETYSDISQPVRDEQYKLRQQDLKSRSTYDDYEKLIIEELSDEKRQQTSDFYEILLIILIVFIIFAIFFDLF